MKKHFLVYGILLFLIFEKVCDIILIIIELLSVRKDLNEIIIYVFLGLSAIVPIMLFFFFLKRLRFNSKNLAMLIVIYVLTFIIIYFMNKQLGVILAENFELNQQSKLLKVQIHSWTYIMKMLSSIIVLGYLAVSSLKGVRTT